MVSTAEHVANILKGVALAVAKMIRPVGVKSEHVNQITVTQPVLSAESLMILTTVKNLITSLAGSSRLSLSQTEKVH